MPCKCNQICNIGRLPGGPCRQPKCRLFFAASFHADLSGRVPCRPSSHGTPPPPGARLPGVTVPARYTQYRAGGMADVTATATTTRTPQRHAATRTRQHHINGSTSCRTRHDITTTPGRPHSNFQLPHVRPRGSSSDTATYHRGSTTTTRTRHAHVQTSNCRTCHTSTSTTRGHAATIRPTPRTHAKMERQHPATRSNFHTGSGQPSTTATYGPIRPHVHNGTKKAPTRAFPVGGYNFLFCYKFHYLICGFSFSRFQKFCFGKSAVYFWYVLFGLMIQSCKSWCQLIQPLEDCETVTA